ncbi:hypothetical protein L1887_28961 [Cichorium endivia]|nr:hypothetical protein L1887_28961 [Cichorium endivia]
MSSPEKSLLAIIVQPVSPRFPKAGTLTAGTQREVEIAVDLSDESTYPMNWEVRNYLPPWRLRHTPPHLSPTKANDLAKPLVDAQINFKIHIAKDHYMKERLYLEVERLGLSVVIWGAEDFVLQEGHRLGSVSDYCVFPAVVVRYPYDKDGGTIAMSTLSIDFRLKATYLPQPDIGNDLVDEDVDVGWNEASSFL